MPRTQIDDVEQVPTNMQLINIKTLVLQDFSLGSIPPYAILSFTCGDDEVTFQKLTTATKDTTKKWSKVVRKGWSKIDYTYRLATKDGFNYA